jgi:hypothetical protein
MTDTNILRDVLACPMGDNDAGAETVKDYLLALLEAIWVEGEGFDGKRPFGNSSWEYDVYEALGRAGLVRIEYDRDGDIEDVDDEIADRLIRDAIRSLRLPKKGAIRP